MFRGTNKLYAEEQANCLQGDKQTVFREDKQTVFREDNQTVCRARLGYIQTYALMVAVRADL